MVRHEHRLVHLNPHRLLQFLWLRLLKAGLDLAFAFLEVCEKVLINLVFSLNEEHRMQFLISPI
jgi:hypothetical protein